MKAETAAELRRIADEIDTHRELLTDPGSFADGERDALEGVARTLRERAEG